ncbi:hypothetical protein AVEN_162868-1 [Araneus ventricosus]|uniref:Uncharacterized protein n=1 Tax=Araneus ventricosus TaxID=182803 RepID=A0A4Y2S3X9_ARAVE|nr:hypothetical protein AVEN_162868-1 [Araneus ventricosus]
MVVLQNGTRTCHFLSSPHHHRSVVINGQALSSKPPFLHHLAVLVKDRPTFLNSPSLPWQCCPKWAKYGLGPLSFKLSFPHHIAVLVISKATFTLNSPFHHHGSVSEKGQGPLSL